MSRKATTVSDLTGELATGGEEAGKLVIRRGPGINPGKPKVIDVLHCEVQTLADSPHMYLVEYRPSDENGEPRVYMMSSTALQELVAPSGKRLLEFLKGLRDYKRGRVPVEGQRKRR